MLVPGHPETAQGLVGRRMRLWRQAKGMGLLEVARSLDIDGSQLSRIEKGKQGLSQHIALRAYAVLGADLHFLFFGRLADLPASIRDEIARLEREGEPSTRGKRAG